MSRERRMELRDGLRGGLFLSSMMEVSDGRFCAERSAGCRMVQLGAYLAEPEASQEERGRYCRAFLPERAEEWEAFLGGQCAAARANRDVLVSLNLAALDLTWALEASRAFTAAGGDLVELNAHGGYWRYVSGGRLRAMVLPENQAELFRWVEALVESEVPLIVKVHGAHHRKAVWQALSGLAGFPLVGVHVNVRDTPSKEPDLDLVRRLKERYPSFLLASGYVRSGRNAADLFDAGADAVGIAEPTVEDSGFISRIAQEMADVTDSG